MKTMLMMALLIVPCLTIAEIKDPTRPLNTITTTSAVPVGAARLESILYASNRRVAIINGQPLAAGEKLGDIKVINISPDKVEVNYQGERQTLSLPKRDIRIANEKQ